MKISIGSIREALRRKWQESRERWDRIPPRPPEEKKRESLRLARAFAVIALVCGLLMTFLLPPFCAPDEHDHFVNIYNIAHGNLFADEDGGQLVRWIPEGYMRYLRNYPASLNGVDNTTRYSFHDLYEQSMACWDEMDWTQTTYPTSITSSGYLISAASMAVGTWIGQFLGFQEVVFPYNQMLLGRIGNLFFYIAVIYFAIRRAPHFNKTMLLIAMMPMSLFLGASLSYDAVLIPVSLYFFALVLDLHVKPEERISGPDIARVVLCVLFLSGMKFGAYIPLAAMLLTVPKTKYGSMRRMLLCIGLVAAAVLVGYLPTMIMNGMSARVEAGKISTVYAVQQREWIGSNLSALPGIFAETFKIRGVIYLYGFWGLIGWLDTYFPLPMMMLGYVVLGITAISETSSFTLWKGKRWKNLFALLGSLVSMIGIMMGMYINFTANFAAAAGTGWIEGVQGRYFIPLFMGFLLAVSNPALQKLTVFRSGKADVFLSRTSLLWGACCAVMTVFILLMRYWI